MMQITIVSLFGKVIWIGQSGPRTGYAGKQSINKAFFEFGIHSLPFQNVVTFKIPAYISERNKGTKALLFMYIYC